MQAYCLKCRATISPIDKKIKLNRESGMRSLVGHCPICGTKINKFLGKKKKEESDDGE